MNVKYLIHPDEYAIGENEKLYADQAARGWLLEKRGRWFSKFRRGEPRRLRYRIELSARNIREDGNLPKEQIDLYEDCGWQYVTCRWRVHVFCAPEHSAAPEFYATPEQHAAMLRGLRREYRFGWAITAGMLGLFLLLLLSGAGVPAKQWWARVRMEWVQYGWNPLFYWSLCIWSLYQLAYGSIRTAALYRSLKRGEPLDHAPKKRHLIHKTVSSLLAACWIASAALMPLQLIGCRSYDMPAVSDGPYLTLAELGVEGARVEDDRSDAHCTVERSFSLVARMWYTREEVNRGGGRVFLDQYVYRMAGPGAALRLAPVLIDYAAVAYRTEGFQAVEVPGLDAAYRSGDGDEYIAVKGNLAYYIMVYASGGAEEPDVLPALAAHET